MTRIEEDPAERVQRALVSHRAPCCHGALEAEGLGSVQEADGGGPSTIWLHQGLVAP